VDKATHQEVLAVERPLNLAPTTNLSTSNCLLAKGLTETDATLVIEDSLAHCASTPPRFSHTALAFGLKSTVVSGPGCDLG